MFDDRVTAGEATGDGPLTPTHYVSASGSATWANATNPATPCSAATAMANAEAGNVVQFATGRYTVAGTDNGLHAALEPAKSGASLANPITFQTDGGVVDFEFSSGTGPVIGVYEHDYIVWDGFTMSEYLCPAINDTGAAILWATDGSTLKNLDITGDTETYLTFDNNHCGIRMEHARYCTVANNRIRDIWTGNPPSWAGTSSNGAGVQCYYVEDNIIEHNEVSGCGSGIFLKAATKDPEFPEDGGGTHVRYNYLHDNKTGLLAHRTWSTNDTPNYWYQNLIVTCGYGNDNSGIRILTWWESGKTPDEAFPPYLDKFVNNTVYDCVIGVFVGDSEIYEGVDIIFWNNVIVASGKAISGGAESRIWETDRLSFEHNVYHDYTTFAFLDRDGGQHSYTFAEWRSSGGGFTFGFDHVTPDGQDADPLFVTEGSNFRLQAESPARDAGIDILNLQGGGTDQPIDCGCYVTGSETIGME